MLAYVKEKAKGLGLMREALLFKREILYASSIRQQKDRRCR